MKNVSIMQSRTLGFVDLFELIPKGGAFFPDFVREVIQGYQFQKYPQSFEQFDIDKGIEFHEGKYGETVIHKLTIFNTLLAVETRAGTTEGMKVIEAILAWSKEKFGFNQDAKVNKWGYVSDLFFQTDFPLIAQASSALTHLAEKTSSVTSKIWGENLSYNPTVLTVGHDPQLRKYTIAGFTIQYRAEFPFSENRYFSEAPLPTELHIQFLEEFEKEVLAQRD